MASGNPTIFHININKALIRAIKQGQEKEKEAQKSNIELGKQLKQWIKYMSDLHKDAILLLGPKRKKGIGKGKAAKIVKHQGIDERQPQEAINEM